MVEVRVKVEEGKAGVQVPKDRPVRTPDGSRPPARGVLLRRFAEPKPARVEQLELPLIEEDRVELVRSLVACSSP